MSEIEEKIEIEERFGAVIRSHPEEFDLEERIFAAIDEGYGDPDFTMADIAAAVGRSQRRIRAIMAAEPESTTLTREIHERRMKRAETLLTETNWAIEMIARQCGYRSASSFTRRFRAAHDGVTPVAYRTQGGGTIRAGGPTGAFRKPAERHRAAQRGLAEPSMRRTTDLPGEKEARSAEIRHAVRQAELRGELGGGRISIAETAAAWSKKVKAKRGERGV